MLQCLINSHSFTLTKCQTFLYKINTLIIPFSIVSINAYAFQQCNNLKAVIIPDGTLTNIGLYAFEGCEKLEYLYLPNTLESVGIRAFANCNKLKCGGVNVKQDKQELVINRGVPKSIFDEYCPQNYFTCMNSNSQLRGLFNTVFIGILLKR